MTEKVCMTCGARATTTVDFPCPECGEAIIRCAHCRSVNNAYKCPKCDFEGP